MLENNFLNHFLKTTNKQNIGSLLKKYPLPPHSDFNIRENRLKNLRHKLLCDNVFNTERIKEVFEYLSLHFRNVEGRNLPGWFSLLRDEAISEGLISFSVMSFDELIDDGWTIKDIVVASMLASSRNIDEYRFSSKSVSHWVKLREKSERFFAGVTCAGDLVGQFSITLISQGEYERFIHGCIDEDNLEGVSVNGAGKYWGYISTVSLDKEFRANGIFPLLFRKFRSIVAASALEGIEFSALAANAYTSSGERLCEILGLEFMSHYDGFGKIYAGNGKF